VTNKTGLQDYLGIQIDYDRDEDLNVFSLETQGQILVGR